MAPEGSHLIAYLSASQSREGSEGTAEKPEHRAEYLPVVTSQHRAIGYHNDTQNRHRPETHLLREESVKKGRVDWASVLALEASEGGILLVKESHKCVNQKGVDTGSFELTEQGVATTRWGLSPHFSYSELREQVFAT